MNVLGARGQDYHWLFEGRCLDQRVRNQEIGCMNGWQLLDQDCPLIFLPLSPEWLMSEVVFHHSKWESPIPDFHSKWSQVVFSKPEIIRLPIVGSSGTCLNNFIQLHRLSWNKAGCVMGQRRGVSIVALKVAVGAP